MSQVRASAILFDALGNPDTCGSLTIQIVAASNNSYSAAPTIIDVGTDGSLLDPIDGLIGVSLATYSIYRMHRGPGPAAVNTPWVLLTTGSAGTMALPVSLGQDPYP